MCELIDYLRQQIPLLEQQAKENKLIFKLRYGQRLKPRDIAIKVIEDLGIKTITPGDVTKRCNYAEKALLSYAIAYLRTNQPDFFNDPSIILDKISFLEQTVINTLQSYYQ